MCNYNFVPVQKDREVECAEGMVAVEQERMWHLTPILMLDESIGKRLAVRVCGLLNCIPLGDWLMGINSRPASVSSL